jgi:4-hydroxy-tetrahydrodipicolinate synthase
MKGVYTALISPFTNAGALDLPAYKRILEDQAAAGVAGVIPCGTTGETPTLTVAEKQTLISTALEVLKGTQVKVLAGTGNSNTEETVQFSRWASDLGVHGVLVVTPYYNKPSQTGLVEHFLAVAQAVNCEVMLYNVPGRTGVSLSASTTCNLAEHPRITTIKDATGDINVANDLIDCLTVHNHKMDILSGDDATYLALMSVGAVGVVSVASNLFPRAMVRIQIAVEQGHMGEALEIHKKYYPLFRDLFMDSNPVPIKYAMHFAGWCSPKVRRPLVEMNATQIETLIATLKRCGIQPGSKA